MKKLLLFLLLHTFGFSNSSILIINSYHKGYGWSDDVINGLERSLYKYKDIDTNILYMDSKRVNSKEYFETLKKLYQIQLKNQKYDLIIAVDRFAYDFILKHYKDFFTDEKILALGLENFSIQKAKQYHLEKKIAVILEKRDLETNAELIQKIYPTVKKLYIINDKSKNGLHTEPQILDLLQKSSSQYEMIYLRANTIENLIQKFDTKNNNEAILFIRFYKNTKGKLYQNFEISNFIKNAKIPVFITDSLFIGKGATGGKIVDLKAFGKSSGIFALQLLKKFEPQVRISQDFQLIFDAQKLEEFTLPVGGIRENYTIVNKRKTFFDIHKNIIEIIIRVSPLFLILIIWITYTIYKKRREQQFIIQQSKLAEIGEVFSSIAHQWKTPLVEITTIAQELFYSTKAFDKDLKEDESFVSDIMKQVNYMTDTINNFQQFIMPSNTKNNFFVDIAIKEMLDIVSHNLKYNNIQITLTVLQDTNCEIFGYKNEFMQSFLNIIMNSKEEFLEKNYKNRKISILLFNKNNFLYIEIEDNAGGIKEKNPYKIFKPYYTTKKQGHGIGLYMTKVIIKDKMGGNITVENKNKGAKFTIQLDQKI